MSPSIGKAPDHRSFALDVEPRVLPVGSRRAAVTFRSPLWRSSAGRGTRSREECTIQYRGGDRDTEDGSIHVSTAAITYAAEAMKRLARLNASVDCDQYVFLPA
jgi:hypothetical protein